MSDHFLVSTDWLAEHIDDGGVFDRFRLQPMTLLLGVGRARVLP